MTPSTEATGAAPPRPWAKRAFAASMLVYLAAAVAAFRGLRGSDQYWYVAEMASILDGTAPFTNYYYVGAIFRSGFVEGTNVFAHHTAVHYMALPLSSVLGPYLGWIATGVVLTALSAFLFRWLIADATGSEWAGSIGSAAYLLSPLIYWSSVNVLQESYQGAVVVLLGFCVYRSVGSVRWAWVTLGVLALGCGIHPIFKIATLTYACAAPWIVGASARPLIRGMVSAAALVAVIVSAWAGSTVFPMTPTHASVLVATEGITNAVGYLEFDLATPSIELVVRKTLRAMKDHVTMLAEPSAVYYSVFYLTLFGLMALAVALRREGERRLLVLFGLTILMLVGYAGVTSLHQLQGRYLMVAYPLTFLCSAIGVTLLLDRASPDGAWATRGRTAAVLCAALFTLGSLGVDGLMARRIGRQAKSEAAESLRLQQLVDVLEPDARMVGLMPAASPVNAALVGNACAPRPYLWLLSELLEDPRTGEILKQYEADTLLAERSVTDVGPRLAKLGYGVEELRETDTFTLYTMRPLEAAAPAEE